MSFLKSGEILEACHLNPYVHKLKQSGFALRGYAEMVRSVEEDSDGEESHWVELTVDFQVEKGQSGGLDSEVKGHLK